MNNLLKTSIALSLLFSLAQAEETKKQKLISQKSFLLSLYGKQDIIRNTSKIQTVVKKELRGLNNISINQNIANIPLRSIMTFEAHPEYPLSILFPNDFKIIDVKVVNKNEATAKKDFNKIEIFFNKTFLFTNVLVTTLNKKTNQLIHSRLLINKYMENKNKLTVINTIYSLEDTKITKLSDLDVLNYYFKKNNKMPTTTDFIIINNITYTIIEDSLNGSIRIKNKLFRITSY